MSSLSGSTKSRICIKLRYFDVNPKYIPFDQFRIGSIIVLQTAGRPGIYNPHLHILLTEGGITPENRWKSVSYIPFDLIHRKWQYHLLNMLKENIPGPRMKQDVDQAWKEYPKGFVAFVEKEKVPPGGGGLARYLAKYVVSPPISVRRILPKGFQRIRYYGLHGNVRYRKVREQLAGILPAKTPASPESFRVVARKPFEQLFFESFGRNPLLCPRCDKPMELELIHHPDYGTIRSYELYTEKQPGQLHAIRGSPLQRTQPVVQLPLPFM